MKSSTIIRCLIIFMIHERVSAMYKRPSQNLFEAHTGANFQDNPDVIRLEHMGRTQANLGDGHIVSVLPVMDIVIRIDETRRLVKHAAENIDPVRYQLMLSQADLALETAESVIDSVGLTAQYHEAVRKHTEKNPAAFRYHIPYPMSSNNYDTHNETEMQEHDREKRQVAIIGAFLAGIGVIAAGVYGAYTSGDLDAIRQAQGQNSQRVNLITAAVEEVATQVGKNWETIKDTQKQLREHMVEDEIFEIVNTLTVTSSLATQHLLSTVSSIMSGVPDPSLFPHEQGIEAFANLTHEAAKRKLVPIITTAYDMAKLHCSYVVDNNGKMHVFIHVPLTSARFTMTLLRFISLPIETNAGYFKIAMKNRYLAATQHPTGTFYTMSDEEFSQCTLINDNYVCPHKYALLKVNNGETGLNQERCLHAIYTKTDKQITQHCQMEEVAQKETVSRLGASEFGIFSQIKTNVKVTCGDVNEDRTVQGMVTFTLKPGCFAETNGHFLWPHLTIRSSGEITPTLAYHPEPFKSFAKLSNSTLLRAKKMEESISQTEEFEREKLNELNAADKLVESFTTGHPLMYLLIATLSISLFLGGAFIYHCRKTKMIKRERQEKEIDLKKRDDQATWNKNNPTSPVNITFAGGRQEPALHSFAEGHNQSRNVHLWDDKPYSHTESTHITDGSLSMSQVTQRPQRPSQQSSTSYLAPTGMPPPKATSTQESTSYLPNPTVQPMGNRHSYDSENPNYTLKPREEMHLPNTSKTQSIYPQVDLSTIDNSYHDNLHRHPKSNSR